MEQNLEKLAHQENERIDIFDEVAEKQAEEHRKVIKQARNMLFIIAGLQLVFSVVLTYINKEDEDKGIEQIFGGVVAAIYVGLGFWAGKKPYVALIVSLVLYCLLIVLGAINDPATLAKGMIMRVAIIIALVKGIRKAKSLEELEGIRNN